MSEETDRALNFLTSESFHDSEVVSFELSSEKSVIITLNIPSFHIFSVKFLGVSHIFGQDLLLQNVISQVSASRLSKTPISELRTIFKNLGGSYYNSINVENIISKNPNSLIISFDSHVGLRFAVICDEVSINRLGE